MVETKVAVKAGQMAASWALVWVGRRDGTMAVRWGWTVSTWAGQKAAW